MKKRLRRTSFGLTGLCKTFGRLTGICMVVVMVLGVMGCSGRGMDLPLIETINMDKSSADVATDSAVEGAMESDAGGIEYPAENSTAYAADMAESVKGGSGTESENWNTEEYNGIEESGFASVKLQPLSTFSADVDTASYSNIRRMLNQGTPVTEIPEGAVRIEEMLNYFEYQNYKEPEKGETFGITIDAADCPWQEDHGLIRIGIRTEAIDFSESPKSNLVFLLDVSGSMDKPNKLPLLKQAFSMLVDNLGEKDRVSIVTYAGADAVVLNGARGNEKGEILEALNYLEAGGGTNGSAGIETAYELAERYFIEGGNNRVILATDGDLNIGQTSESELKSIIEEKRKSGIYLSVLGFGDGNLKDNKLETLADSGNGNYAYIDSLMEAKRVLVDELGSTLVTVAEDVKFQVEFNPAWIQEYRLLGYENRLLAAEDFTDDTKDAGEVGAGHTVTVLYEVVWTGEEEENDIHLKYQEMEIAEANQKEWATLKIRYKEPGKSKSQEIEQPFGMEVYQMDVKDADMLLEASVAEFGLLLRDSQWKGNASYDHILDMWSNIMYGGNEEVAEFLSMVKVANNEATCIGLPPVYKDNLIALAVEEGSVTSTGACFLLENVSDETYYYGEMYTLEKWDGADWVTLKTKDNIGWNDIAYILDPGKEQRLELNWEWCYGNLPQGSYRLHKEVYSEQAADSIIISAEFEVEK